MPRTPKISQGIDLTYKDDILMHQGAVEWMVTGKVRGPCMADSSRKGVAPVPLMGPRSLRANQ